MRKVFALIVSVSMLAFLSGCTSSSNDSGCSPLAASGSASELVKVPENINEEPVVTFGTPLYTKETQRTVLVPGEGPTIGEGQLLFAKYSLFSGRTGELLNKTSYTDKKDLPTFMMNDQVLRGIYQGLRCSQIGSRVAVVTPASEIFNEPDSLKASGLTADEALVFVFDVLDSSLARSNGVPQPAQSGFPSVVLAADGRPGITVPSGKAPAEELSTTLKKGSGQVVGEGDVVSVHYTSVDWAKKTVVHSSWGEGVPELIQATTQPDSAEAAVVPGIVGQTVGSQYLVVVPSTAGTNGAGSATIYVVDVLGVH